ncbi:MAG: hypothetical protein AVDCRST_MAG89-4695, partial [uncultured Gemmatimonadetes bacterium]
GPRSIQRRAGRPHGRGARAPELLAVRRWSRGLPLLPQHRGGVPLVHQRRGHGRGRRPV